MGSNYREQIFPALTALADMIKLSDEDLRKLYPGLSETQAVNEIRAINSHAQILLTRGEDGMALYTCYSYYEQSAYIVDVADTVGAGDASMAGWIAAEMSGISDLQERLRFSTACASKSCSYFGAYAPTMTEVKKILSQDIPIENRM